MPLRDLRLGVKVDARSRNPGLAYVGVIKFRWRISLHRDPGSRRVEAMMPIAILKTKIRPIASSSQAYTCCVWALPIALMIIFTVCDHSASHEEKGANGSDDP